MTKQLYEEALADVKKVKEIAESNAKRAIMDVVTPRIRDLIEKELLREGDLDELDGDDLAADAISTPDEEGKVTLDLDALQQDVAGSDVDPTNSELSDKEYELNLEGLEALLPLHTSTKIGSLKDFELSVYRLGESLNRFATANRLIKETKTFRTKISQMISGVEDMYDYLQESVDDVSAKESYETKLEQYFQKLTKLQEQANMSQKRKSLNEEDVTLKLTGLPDDVDLDSVGVDLVTGGDDDEEGGDDDLDLDSDSGDSDDLDLSDVDLDDGDSDDGEEKQMGEARVRRLSDDTVVEIDENMLRREISRMRKLREEATPSMKGAHVTDKEAASFGDGHVVGQVLDVDIRDADDLTEMDELEEGDELDESDELDEIGDRSERDRDGSSATSIPSSDKTTVRVESIKRRLAFEKNLQERAKSRAAVLKRAAGTPGARVATLQSEYKKVVARFNESVERENKLKKTLAETRLRTGSGKNASLSRSAGSRTEKTLRSKLAETNLTNAKLQLTNRLLQNESLTSRQKRQVVEKLDSVTTVREAKLVYESLLEAFVSGARSVNENTDRRVLGSSSRTTRPASSQSLNEGHEANRWAKLAGIVKLRFGKH